MAEVTLRDVRKVYAGGVEAVKGVSFSIPDGGFCVLVGPSGCGKSTLLRMVAGLETISSGDVAIGGRVVNQIEPADRDIAMVFQNYALYPHMSVYDNIAYGLRNRGTPKAEIEARVAEAARILAIEPFLQRKPRALSGGQRQRVAMGRAIVRKPQVFLFDEPLSNLDAKLRVQMRVEIKKLQRALGVTSIYVTHDQVEAMTLSDKLVVMNAGEVEQIGTPTQIYRRPESRFVATFIGSPPMNLLPGVVEADGRVALDGVTLASDDMRAGLAPGTRVEVGVRPEEAEIAPQGAPGTPFAIDFIEELGATELLHGFVAGAPFILQVATGAVPAGLKALTLSIPARCVHVFDAQTGKRLGRVESENARAA
ncbi:sn-glycerol-3-phosphate import ATP-binding protein UgpC [Alsobacter sp. KACC 23698]|uniref:Sn-glycerol-3-phosphate import ATP-binding protein UgpC n=1 Tax=Alsobacter sp. KACC 23698 TaxID=3149229 RepID=A0AAU7JFU3_9HYPH